MQPLSRRQFLARAASSAAITAFSCPALATEPDTLKAAGAAQGILVGSAVSASELRKDQAYAALVRQQCRILVSENDFKFGPLRPSPESFFFDNADFIARFAAENGMKLRGHNFVWHQQLPGWFRGYVTPQNAEQVLVHHIETVGGRYAGRVHSWDVVNEAIQIPDNLPGGLRNSPWQKVLPNYIDIAFRTARRVDPHALLTYNDYGIEGEGAAAEAKRKAVLALLRGMQDRNVPVDAFGIQSHLSAVDAYGPGLASFMNTLRGMGLKLMVTEMDVNDKRLPAPPAQRDPAVAQVYANYLRTVLANPSLIALLTWGITDKYTWLNHYEGGRHDGQPERPLPFDADLKPKPAFAAELGALQRTPKR